MLASSLAVAPTCPTPAGPAPASSDPCRDSRQLLGFSDGPWDLEVLATAYSRKLRLVAAGTAEYVLEPVAGRGDAVAVREHSARGDVGPTVVGAAEAAKLVDDLLAAAEHNGQRARLWGRVQVGVARDAFPFLALLGTLLQGPPLSQRTVRAPAPLALELGDRMVPGYLAPDALWRVALGWLGADHSVLLLGSGDWAPRHQTALFAGLDEALAAHPSAPSLELQHGTRHALGTRLLAQRRSTTPLRVVAAASSSSDSTPLDLPPGTGQDCVCVSMALSSMPAVLQGDLWRSLGAVSGWRTEVLLGIPATAESAVPELSPRQLEALLAHRPQSLTLVHPLAPAVHAHLGRDRDLLVAHLAHAFAALRRETASCPSVPRYWEVDAHRDTDEPSGCLHTLVVRLQW